jgi:acyl-CoA reductase-like NAD-dependent aldehyde dehydrogenase
MVHRIAQEIRHLRALLTAHETWQQRQPTSETRAEEYRRITFWRRVLKGAEQQLACGDVGEADGPFHQVVNG